MRVQLTPRYLLAFLCLAAVLGIGHELAHHITGFLICGGWGYKSFNSFRLVAGCQQNHPDTFWLATLAGSDTLWGMPYLVLITEGLAYLGYYLNKQHLGMRARGVEHTADNLPA